MIHFKVEDGDGVGWLHVQINAATETSFDIKVPRGEYTQVLEQLCRFIPVTMRLDSDLAEAYGDAGRTHYREADLLYVQEFSKLYELRDVNCSFPGFND